MLMIRARYLAQEVGAQDLHVARQDNQVDVVLGKQAQLFGFGGRLGRGR